MSCQLGRASALASLIDNKRYFGKWIRETVDRRAGVSDHGKDWNDRRGQPVRAWPAVQEKNNAGSTLIAGNVNDLSRRERSACTRITRNLWKFGGFLTWLNIPPAPAWDLSAVQTSADLPVPDAK